MNTSALPIAVAQALLANSPAGIAVFAGDTGECLLANGMLAEITGGSVEALRLQIFRTLASWRDSGLADAAEATLADGVPRQHETTTQTSFGKDVTLDCSLYRFDFEGKPHLMLVASDVTERRRAEQALAVREQELRTLIETVPDLIVRYDRELHRTYVNPAWEQASGLSAREVINVPAAAIPKVPNPAHAEYVQKVGQVLETGTPQKIGFSWVNAFGAELYLEYVIVPEHDRSGAITGVLAVGRDLSERRRAEEVLQKSEALLNATQQLAKVGGWEFDVISGKSFWTEELYRIHEIPNDPGIDHIKESLECYRPEDRQIIYDAFQRACERGESYDLEFPFTTYTGKSLWIRTSVQPVYEEGKVVRLVGNLMDITERKQTEEALRLQTAQLEEEVTERQVAQENLQEKALLLEEEIEKHQNAQVELEKLNDELEQRVMLAELSAEIGCDLTASGKLQNMLKQCSESLVRHLNVAFVRIWTFNDAENVLELQASAGLYTRIDGSHSRVPVGKFKIGLIAEERKPHITNAVLGDPRIHDQEWAKREGMVAFAGHPLIIGDELVGVMAMFSRDQLSDLTLKALESVSNEIAIGIERKRNEEALEQLNEKLEQRVQQRTTELDKKNRALERFNKLFVNRELRMMELKERIKELEEKTA